MSLQPSPQLDSPVAARAVQSDTRGHFARTQRLLSLDAYRGLIMLTLLCGGIFHSLKGHPVWANTWHGKAVFTGT
jgi:hypothetical protein